MSTAIQTKNRVDGSLKPQVPDFCPACDATDQPFQPMSLKVDQEFRGETFPVEAPAMACKHCGFVISAPGQLEALRVNTLEAYRRHHGLLTSTQIVSRRAQMGMTQRTFALYIGVGVASLQRWEKGLVVQDKASDTVIRVSTDHTRFAPSAKNLIKAIRDRITVKAVHYTLPTGEVWTAPRPRIKTTTDKLPAPPSYNDPADCYAIAAAA